MALKHDLAHRYAEARSTYYADAECRRWLYRHCYWWLMKKLEGVEEESLRQRYESL